MPDVRAQLHPRDRAPISPTAKWSAAGLVVSVVGWLLWSLVHGDEDREYIGPIDMHPILQAFQHDLEATLAEDPPNADHLRQALSRIDAESDKWKGYVSEVDVMQLKTALAAKLATVSDRR